MEGLGRAVKALKAPESAETRRRLRCGFAEAPSLQDDTCSMKLCVLFFMFCILVFVLHEMKERF